LASADNSDLRVLETLAPPLSVRLRVQIVLRWMAVIGQLAAVLVVYFGFGFPLPLVELLLIISLSVALNIWLGLRFSFSHLLSRTQTAGYLAYDLVQLSALLYLTGGLLNPFALLFLAPVTVSASLLNGRTTIALVVLASFLVSGLLWFSQPLPWQGEAPQIPELYRIALWAALLLGLVFIPSYVWRVSREGRRMWTALTATRSILAREQRLSALDGLAAAAAHQLGTPLGTIVLVSGEMQNNPDVPAAVQEDLALMREQALRCREILTSLTSEEDMDPVISTLSMRGLMDEAILEAGLHDKQMHVSCQAEGEQAGDEPRLARRPELIYGLGNILENAAEFATAHVWLSATYSADEIRIRISDDGPGFSSDILAHLGEPYTSSRRQSGSRRREVTSENEEFGLGLGYFIARTLLQRSGGQLNAYNLRLSETAERAEELRKTGAEPSVSRTGACVEVVWPRQALEQQY
jgi:two-component system sensor histidine kinase RegB